MKDSCNLSATCKCDCPEHIECPLDIASPLEKNRSASRTRHHAQVKEKLNNTEVPIAGKIKKIRPISNKGKVDIILAGYPGKPIRLPAKRVNGFKEGMEVVLKGDYLFPLKS